MVDLYQVFRAELNSPGRPVGNLLFLGPTGAGKTRVVEATAEVLFGDPRAAIKVDRAEFQHPHEIAKLIGSPPGYLGHREMHPLITDSYGHLAGDDVLREAAQRTMACGRPYDSVGRYGGEEFLTVVPSSVRWARWGWRNESRGRLKPSP